MTFFLSSSSLHSSLHFSLHSLTVIRVETVILVSFNAIFTLICIPSGIHYAFSCVPNSDGTYYSSLFYYLLKNLVGGGGGSYLDALTWITGILSASS